MYCAYITSVLSYISQAVAAAGFTLKGAVFMSVIDLNSPALCVPHGMASGSGIGQDLDSHRFLRLRVGNLWVSYPGSAGQAASDTRVKGKGQRSFASQAFQSWKLLSRPGILSLSVKRLCEITHLILTMTLETTLQIRDQAQRKPRLRAGK